MINAANFDNKGFRIYNIGTSKPTKIIKLLHMLEEIFEKNAKINYIESNPGELSMIVCDNSKAINELGWKLNYDLQSGLISMKASLERNNN
jgi:UDP-glucose 4-epimerase